MQSDNVVTSNTKLALLSFGSGGFVTVKVSKRWWPEVNGMDYKMLVAQTFCPTLNGLQTLSLCPFSQGNMDKKAGFREKVLEVTFTQK